VQGKSRPNRRIHSSVHHTLLKSMRNRSRYPPKRPNVIASNTKPMGEKRIGPGARRAVGSVGDAVNGTALSTFSLIAFVAEGIPTPARVLSLHDWPWDRRPWTHHRARRSHRSRKTDVCIVSVAPDTDESTRSKCAARAPGMARIRCQQGGTG